MLADVTRAIKAAATLPVQAQCEPPADFAWFERLADAGVDSLGMHLEAVTERVRQRIMPGKAEVPIGVYLEAFASAVDVFGRGQVSTYILAGLGDSRAEILELCDDARRASASTRSWCRSCRSPERRSSITPPPSPAFMQAVLTELSALLRARGMSSESTSRRAAGAAALARHCARGRRSRMLDRDASVGRSRAARARQRTSRRGSRASRGRSTRTTALRRAIFADEQELFESSDVDAADARATPIVALSQIAGMPDEVVGVVRIYETEPDVWFGGRLGVCREYRRRGAVGGALIVTAVSTRARLGLPALLRDRSAAKRPLLRASPFSRARGDFDSAAGRTD